MGAGGQGKEVDKEPTGPGLERQVRSLGLPGHWEIVSAGQAVQGSECLRTLGSSLPG